MIDSPVNTLLKGLSTLINQVPALCIYKFQQIINAIQRYLAGGSLLPEPESLANKCPPPTQPLRYMMISFSRLG
jgi:hypothetical protein